MRTKDPQFRVGRNSVSGAKYALLEVLSIFSVLHDTHEAQHSFAGDNFITQLVQTVFELAEERVGATIVLCHAAHAVLDPMLHELSKNSKVINKPFTPAGVKRIFRNTASPLHDGALGLSMCMQRLFAAAIKIPVDPPNYSFSPTARQLKQLGTRHWSAYSLSHYTASPVLVVSSETGYVTLFTKGTATFRMSRNELYEALVALRDLHMTVINAN